MPALLVAAETTEIVGTVSIAAVLVTAFGYALSLLSSGTKRRDETSDDRVAEAEAERDRARAEKATELAQARADSAAAIAAVREDLSSRLAAAERETRYWRARALGESEPT